MRARSSGSTASAPRRSAAPHQRLQDQRGRGDPAAAHGELHRRHRAHQHRAQPAQQAATVDALEAFFAQGELPLVQERRRRRDPFRPNCWKTACSRRSLLRGQVREPETVAALDGCSSTRCKDTLPQRTSSPICRTTLRASWKTQIRAPLQAHLRRRRARADRRRMPAHPRPRARRVASGWRCTCTPATATCTPTSRSTATTTRCCRPPRGGGAHHGAGAQPGRRDLRRARHRHHQARIPQRRGTRRFTDYKRRVDPEGRFNKGKLLRGGDSRADLTNAFTPSFG